MNRVVSIALAIVLLASPAEAVELRVVDGDTFELGAVTIRIENIDAPETRQARCAAERSLGLNATARLDELLASADALELVRHGRDRDRYGRLLRRVLVDGVDAGETLVSEGLARPWGGKRRPWCE